MINASRIRAMNDKIDLMMLMRPGALDAGDADYFPVRPSFEPRPASDDAFDTKLSDGGALGISRKSDGPIRTPDAELVCLETSQNLCNACLSALGHLAKYLEQKLTIPNRYSMTDRLPPNVVLHWNLLALESSRMDGCHLCSLISAHVNPSYLSRLEIMQDCRVELVLHTNLEDAGSSELSDERPTKKAEDTRLACCLTPNSTPERTNQTYWPILKLRFWPSAMSDSFFLAQGPTSGSASPDQLEVAHRGANTRYAKGMAVDWLDRCTSNHGKIHDACVTQSSSWLPTRLIDLTNAELGGRVTIVSTAKHPELFVTNRPPYITLSHCWGDWRKSRLPRLLEENKSNYELEGIPFDELPPLVRDAMEIAGWFKVRWLWIDSLCIIQDSPGMSDWNHEALLMCKVYKYGLLNISADASDNAQGGCFRDRPQAKVTPFKFHMTNLQKSWWAAMDERNVFEWVTTAPLSRRAWVFQERQLARRVLHFTKHEVFWECCADEPYCACETYPAGSPFETRFLNVNKYEPSRLLTEDDRNAKLQSWFDLCEDFSVKSLTFETDRLPALAGLAIEYAALFPEDCYAAGFWSSSLPAALLWSTESPNGKRDQNDTYVAPSWSWLSLGSPISFGVLPKTYPKSRREISRVCDINMTPSTPSPFGRIQPGGYIELEGFLRSIRIVRTHVSSNVDEADRWYMPSKTYDQVFYLDNSDRAHKDSSVGSPLGPSFSYSLDYRGDSDEEAKEMDKDTENTTTSGTKEWTGFCFLVALSHEFKDDDSVLEALLLDKASSGNVFRRAGHISFSGHMGLPLVFQVQDTISDNEIATAARDILGTSPRLQKESKILSTSMMGNSGNEHPSDDSAAIQDHDRRKESVIQNDGDPLSLYDLYQSPNDSSFAKLTSSKIKII